MDVLFESDLLDPILIEVESEVDLVSLEELSFKNSFAELSDFGGDDDLELAVDDFLEDAVDVFDTFLMDDAVELFLVELTELCPTLTNPKLIASSRPISLPHSGSVKMPVFSSISPLRRAS